MNNKVLKIGITGGIGSGKSYVCQIFESLSYQVYYADKEAKALMHSDLMLVEEVKQLFGKEAYLPEGELNRKYVGNIVFNDPSKLESLNALVHPAVARDFEKWYASIPADYPHDFVLKEAAILYESGAYKASDAVICVYAPKKLRIERVLRREKTDLEAILSRMAQQWAEAKKMNRADFTIYNDGKHHLLPQLRKAIGLFRKTEFVGK